jgi:hypothetical protein
MRTIMMKHGNLLDGNQWRAEDRFEYLKVLKSYKGIKANKKEE